MLKGNYPQTILDPVGPGKATVTVALAGVAVKLPILVVPLNVALGESVDSVVGKMGLPDDDLFVLISWPETKRVHNLFYYDNLRGDSSRSAHHWKYLRYPGLVLAVDMGKVVNVNSTSPEYRWPKDEEWRLQH